MFKIPLSFFLLSFFLSDIVSVASTTSSPSSVTATNDKIEDGMNTTDSISDCKIEPASEVKQPDGNNRDLEGIFTDWKLQLSNLALWLQQHSLKAFNGCVQELEVRLTNYYH